MSYLLIAAALLAALLILLAIWDLLQTQHAILRNFPLIGHLRYLLERIGPELRQYIVTDNDEERPFSRDQRRWIYASAKQQNSYFGFGTDNQIEKTPGYLIIQHSAFPLPDRHPGDADHDPDYSISSAKILGEARDRRGAFRLASVINTSAMSFGSLSAPAVEAINRGCQLAGCLQNTGEGGIAPHHRHGGELIWQLGTGYFGARARGGGFSMERFLSTVEANPVRAIEVKLSQGAKPGLGGVLPAAKITAEIAAIRGIERGRDCISPAFHHAFSDVDGLIDFVELLAAASGLPVGIKSAVGQLSFWTTLAERMEARRQGPDYIAVDGGEGGTGAAPLVFSDHVALPFKTGFSRVYRIFAETGLCDRVLFIGSGKLGLPENAVLAFALGCDAIAVGREAMLAIGCIQAQRCHTGHCPTGVATQGKWLAHGLDPTSKAARLANYLMSLRKELLRLSRACGVEHPGLLTLDHLEILDGKCGSTPARELFGYKAGWGLPRSLDLPRPTSAT